MSTIPSDPTVIVLAGVNGAGKTTSSRSLLANTLKAMTFVNADVIAQGLSGFDPDAAALRAGRILLQQLDGLSAQRASFAFETIRQRYERSIRNLFALHIPVVSSWKLYDNSITGWPRLIAEGEQRQPAVVVDPDVWTCVQRSAGNG